MRRNLIILPRPNIYGDLGFSNRVEAFRVKHLFVQSPFEPFITLILSRPPHIGWHRFNSKPLQLVLWVFGNKVRAYLKKIKVLGYIIPWFSSEIVP